MQLQAQPDMHARQQCASDTLHAAAVEYLCARPDSFCPHPLCMDRLLQQTSSMHSENGWKQRHSNYYRGSLMRQTVMRQVQHVCMGHTT